jgi:L-ascorbate metabolism protein UlaG (beta-lactamase superfamily)
MPMSKSDVNSSITKRRLSKSETPGCNANKRQNTLQYYFFKNTTAESTTPACPICNEFKAMSIMQLEQHVNTCLDSIEWDDNPAPSQTTSASDQEKQTDIKKVEINKCGTPQDLPLIEETNTKTVLTKSWAKLFHNSTFKVCGIWSSKKQDIAPGMNESEQSWFGEPRSASTEKKRRPLPYYKRLAGTRVVVDAFSFGEIQDCEGYLLSHFHSDHYMGLTANWMYGPIYCSEITARLVKTRLGVAADFIHPLPMNIPCLLSGTDGLTVTLIDANHCPGAVIFLVTTKDNLRYLHTGDFRACPKMCLHPMLKDKPLDIVYLDTTYLDPKYSFPSQDACIASACQVVKRHQSNEAMRNEDPKINHWFVQKETVKEQVKLLVVVGTYSLGKERIFIG